MTDKEADMLQEEFEDWWLDVCIFANSTGYPVSYIEDEFIIDGVFEKPTPREDNLTDYDGLEFG